MATPETVVVTSENISSESRSSIQQDRRAESTRKLLEAAAFEFGAKGYAEAKIADIAARAGLTQGLVTQRFKTKENLFLLVIREQIEKCTGTMIRCAAELNPACCSESTIWNSGLKDSLLTIIHTIKQEAGIDSDIFRFACAMINPKEIPEAAKIAVYMTLNGATGRNLLNQLSTGSAEGKIISGSPENLLMMFVRSCLSLTKCCIETGLELQSDDIYLRLIGLKTTEIAADDQRRAVAASLSNDFDYVVYIDMKTLEVSRFFASPMFTQEVIRNDEMLGKGLPTAHRMNYMIKRIIIPETLPSTVPRFDDVNVFLDYMYEHRSLKFQAMLNIGPEKTWYRFKFVIDDRNPDGIVFGIINVHSQIMHAYEEGESNARLISEDLYRKAILSNAYSYFRVNLSRNRVISPIIEKVEGQARDYTDKFENHDSIMPRYDEIIDQAADRYVDDDFRENYRKFFSSSNLMSLFRNGETMTEFLCRIYSTTLGWHYRKYVVYISSDPATDDIQAMIVAYNVTDDVSDRMEREHAQSIISLLAKEYTGLYYVNIDNFSAELFSLSNRIEGDTGKLIRNDDFTVKRGNFAPIYEMFVKNSVHPDDRDMMMGVLNDVKKLLSDTKNFSVMFRRNYGGEYLYTEMTIVKVENISEEAHHVILGFMEKDDVYRRQKESERVNEVIAALSGEYSSVFFYDMNKDIVIPYMINDRLKTRLPSKWENVSYREAVSMYVDRAVASESREEVKKKLTLSHIFSMLEGRENYSFEYQNDIGRYCEFKVTYAGDDESSLVIGFADKDDAIRARLEKEAEISRNYQIIKTLASEYSSVYYVQVSDGTLVPYSICPESEKDFGALIRDGIVYSRVFRIYVNEYIYGNDREMVLKACSFDNVLRELRNRKRYTVVFRRVIDGEIKYAKVSYVKLEEENDEPTAFTVALDYNDAPITAMATFSGIDNISADRMMLNSRIVNSLAHRFENTYCIDLEKDSFVVTGIKDSDGNPYTERILAGASYTELALDNLEHYVAPSYRDIIEKTCSLDFLREEFKKHDSFSYTFLSTFNGKGQYRDMLFTKLEDDSDSFRFIWAFSDVNERVMAEKGHARELKMKTEELQRMNEDIIELLGNVVEGRDLESGQHIQRVKRFTKILATQVQKDIPRYCLTNSLINVISSASVLHDVGKIMIPDAVLLKPGKLTPEEFSLMKTHCEKGCRILEKAPSDWSDDFFRTSMDICRWHHEKYDGSGYPDGLKGDEIPISAQIVSVVDCFDALVSKRVYKDAYPCEKAFEMIENGECGVFSGELMECFRKCKDRFFMEYEVVRKQEGELK